MKISLEQISRMKLSIDPESVNIYIDNGDDQDPTHICYWQMDEWEEDSEVIISSLNAVDLFYRDKFELLERLGYEIEEADNELQFNYQELEEVNIIDLKKWTDEEVLSALIDENCGGIIGYVHADHIDRIVGKLNEI